MSQEQILKIITENPGIELCTIRKIFNNSGTTTKQVEALRKYRLVRREKSTYSWRLYPT